MYKHLLATTYILTIVCSSHAQMALHVAFNISNCEAHSKSIASLGELPEELNKRIYLDRLDSSLTPWFIERFELGTVRNIEFQYLSSSALHDYMGRSGNSTCFLLLEGDTVLVVDLDELPSRLEEINGVYLRTLGSSSSSSRIQRDRPFPHTGNVSESDRNPSTWQESPIHKMDSPYPTNLLFRELVQEPGDPGISSVIQVVQTGGTGWVLDAVLDNIFRIDSISPERSTLTFVGSIGGLLQRAAAAKEKYAEYECAALKADALFRNSSDPDRCSIAISCTDTLHKDPETGYPRYWRVVLTIHSNSPPTLMNVADDSEEHGYNLMIGPSGSGADGDKYFAQIYPATPVGIDGRLFAQLRFSSDSMSIDKIVDYNYYTAAWRALKPYNLVNGHFCNGYFTYALAPLLISLGSWKEIDFSASLGLQLDTLLASSPGSYYAFDVENDGTRVQILCMVKGRLYLVRCSLTDVARCTSYSAPLDLNNFMIRAAWLDDHHRVILLSADLNRIAYWKYD